MKNPNLGMMLRDHRKAAKYTVTQVVERLNRDYDIQVTKKAIYGWESGQNIPSADRLLALCKIYGITNLVESLGYDDRQNMPR